MTDIDITPTTPLTGPNDAAAPLLMAVTILSHPERSRVGQQAIAASADGGLEVSRYVPLFMCPGGEGLPLGAASISRQPVRFARDADDNVIMTLPASPMAVEVDGRVVTDTVRFDASRVAVGVVLTLGRAVVLCLHWMNCLPRHNPVPGLAGVGAAAIGVRDQIRMVAPTALPVLLLGETGSGKDVAARAIHALSPRAGAPLVAVNMAALGESLAPTVLFGAQAGAGLFAQAGQSTLFLDEIGSAPGGVQPMLLRVLDGGDYRPVGPLGDMREQRSSARLIAASGRDLERPGFDDALLHRLEGFTIRMPPLRARREDIGVLIAHLLAEQGAAIDLPVALVAELAAFDWPGNVRQLAQALRRATLLLRDGVVPTLEQLVRTTRPQARDGARAAVPDSHLHAAEGRRKPSALSDEDVLEAMAAHAWNIQAAAQSLGISRPSLYKLLEDHPQIRRAEVIPEQDIAHAMADCGGDLERCAALLKTPTEALRRRWRLLRSLN